MNNRVFTRMTALLLAGWLLAAPVLSSARAAEEGEEIISISFPAQLVELAENCALDTWSQGKTVRLDADLDLSGLDFAPIPTFGGTFLGQGHTISGLRLTGTGSDQGLFRYIQPGAVVRDLTVHGLAAPDGSRSTVGGLAGVNEGTLQSCAFQGAVTGETAVGGLVGRNGTSGQIVNCSAAGTVNGHTATGGIAGRNAGLLLKCTNRAGVNLTEWDSRQTLTELDAESVLTDRAVSDEEDPAGLLDGSTDTGGIAGYSSGVIQSCTNHGDVGYPHVGYNAGGIAGRQCGYLSGCVNTGSIHGRKDVGGIAGQAEPYVVLDPGRDTLERLRTELDTLDRLIGNTLDDAQRTGDAVSARLEAMGTYAGDARDRSRDLLDRLSDFTDENIGEVNTLAADITGALDRLSPALEDLSDAGRRLEQLSDRLGDALGALDGAADAGGAAMSSLRDAAADLAQAQRRLSDAAAALRQSLEALAHVVFPPEGGGPVQPSPEDLEAARAGLRQALDTLKEAGSGLEAALSALKRAADQAGPLPDRLRDALGDLQDAAAASGAIGRGLRRAFDTMEDAVDALTRDGPPSFTPLGEGFRQSSDGLFDALSGLSGEMDGLRASVQEGNGTLTGGLRAVSRQFNVVLDLVLDALTDLGGGNGGESGALIQDTSEEDIAATREGKVDSCRNTGAVEGDRNVGGVIGAVGIEVGLDPEDDRTDRFSFGSTYETKAVVQTCVNQGAVTAKKDCAGGIAGRMDLGTALDCQNYGPVASTGGDYAGGIAGFADAALRRCYAKSVLSGGDYVGGIAGWGSSLRECCAIASVTGGNECLGAIAGGVDRSGVLRDNRFVDTGLAGVDGVSYAGCAEPVPFDQLAQLPGVPEEFTAFTLTLLAQGETVARIPFLYGEDLSRVQLPPVPEQEGSYGRWPDFDTSGLRSDVTVEAVYAPWVTLVASGETDGKLSLALAEGRFTQEAALHVQPASIGLADAVSSVSPEEDVWEVVLTGTELGPEDQVALRLLDRVGGGAEVLQYRDGRWTGVETRRNGSYLLLTMTGTRGVFRIQPQESPAWILPAAIGAGGGVLAVLVLAAGRHRRRKRAVPAGAEQPEGAAAGK